MTERKHTPELPARHDESLCAHCARRGGGLPCTVYVDRRLPIILAEDNGQCHSFTEKGGVA